MTVRSHPPGTAQEDGFSLIELLVVMVIIGILAAIAIPSFLAQRDKGYQAAMKSDLKNASLAERAYAADYSGVYSDDTVTSATTNSPLVNQGDKVTNGVTITAKAYGTNNDSYCISASFSSKSATTFWLTSTADSPVNSRPAGCP